jgi:glycosidase
MMLSSDRLYRDPASLVTFLGLHDVSRIRNDKGATTAGIKLGFTFLLTTRGTPLIYYGDEIGMPGGGDPDNRRDFPGGWPGDARNAFDSAGRTAEEQELFAHVQKLLQLRAARPGLRGARTQTLIASEQQLVYRRGESVVALNNDTTAVTLRIPAPTGGLGADLLGVCQAPRVEGRELVLMVPVRAGCVFAVSAR